MAILYIRIAMMPRQMKMNLFLMLGTMMGMMVLIISLVISIALATLSYDYWNLR